MTLILFPRHSTPANAVRPARQPEPAKLWRNRWRALEHIVIDRDRLVRPGAMLDGDRAWPSKDMAESVAARDLAFVRFAYGRAIVEHLGAFPAQAPAEGGRP